MIGTQAHAVDAFQTYAYGCNVFTGQAAELIGRGEDRSAYLIGGVVYKVGRRASANKADHANLSAAREAGHEWAIKTALYFVADEDGDAVPVLAAQYVKDDGSEMAPEVAAQFRAETGGQVDRIGGNYAVVNGRPYVLDGCTL